MTSRSLTALVVLNAVLLAAIVVTAFAPSAEAQFGAPSQFMMIAGDVRARNSQQGIYIIDRRTARIIGLFFNSSNDRVEPVAPPRSVAADVRRLQGP